MDQTDQNIETQKISVARNAMNYGAMIGVVLVLISLVFYILGMENNNVVGWIQFLFLLAGLVLSILYYRKNVEGGYITYGKSLGTGVLTGLFASIIVGLYIYVFFKFIDPAAVDKIITKAEEAIINKNPDISDADLEKIMNMQHNFMTPLWMAFISMITFTFYSFIASLVISIFTRKTDKSFEANFR
jgi:hypothetical protein